MNGERKKPVQIIQKREITMRPQKVLVVKKTLSFMKFEIPNVLLENKKN